MLQTKGADTFLMNSVSIEREESDGEIDMASNIFFNDIMDVKKEINFDRDKVRNT